jgi:hypothetical protein
MDCGGNATALKHAAERHLKKSGGVGTAVHTGFPG